MTQSFSKDYFILYVCFLLPFTCELNLIVEKVKGGSERISRSHKVARASGEGVVRCLPIAITKGTIRKGEPTPINLSYSLQEALRHWPVLVIIHVDSQMLHQIVASGEPLSASVNWAIIGAFARMDAHMALQMLLALEAFAAAFHSAGKLARVGVIGDHEVVRRGGGEAGHEFLRQAVGDRIGEGLALGLGGRYCPVGGEVGGGEEGLVVGVAPDDLGLLQVLQVSLVGVISGLLVFRKKGRCNGAHV